MCWLIVWKELVIGVCDEKEGITNIILCLRMEERLVDLWVEVR